MNKPESPIEESLYIAMLHYRLDPVCQYRIGKYRVDFAFPKQRLVVEADGKNWHRGWRKRRDNRRDKWLRSQAWNVVRFTGKEIHQSAYACAAKIACILKHPSAESIKEPNVENSNRRKLNDKDLMFFGKWKGTPLGRVPDSYWKWFLKQDWCSKYPDLVEYAKITEED